MYMYSLSHFSEFLTFALTFSNDAGLTKEKHIKNTSWGEGRRGQIIMTAHKGKECACSAGMSVLEDKGAF